MLTPDIRDRIQKIRAQVGAVSIHIHQGTMSFIVTRHGLAVRWPGPIDAPLAIFVRDLLIDMRSGILANLDRKATAGGEGYRVLADASGGSRVAADAEPLATAPATDARRARSQA